MDTSIRFEIRNDVASITLNAPPLNILTTGMMDAISGCLERVAAESDLKAVVLRANGRAFSAGTDINEHRPENAPAMIASFGRLVRLLDDGELPVVMAVSGPALGGGFELAMMADVLLASEKATFGLPEVRLGFFAPVGVIRLPALVGPAKAMEIACSGRVYAATEMAASGVVSRVVPSGELESEVETVCDDFRRSSPLILRMNARMLKGLRGRDFQDALTKAESVFCAELMQVEDVQEGLNAFFERRPPVWKNR